MAVEKTWPNEAPPTAAGDSAGWSGYQLVRSSSPPWVTLTVESAPPLTSIELSDEQLCEAMTARPIKKLEPNLEQPTKLFLFDLCICAVSSEREWRSLHQ